MATHWLLNLRYTSGRSSKLNIVRPTCPLTNRTYEHVQDRDIVTMER